LKKLLILIVISTIVLAKEFEGISKLYEADDSRMEQLAKKDAIQDAYKRVSEYFGLAIKSNLEIQKESNGVSANTKVKQDIKIKSNLLISGIKPSKISKKFTKDGKYYRIYVILKLDPITEEKIKKQIQKDKKELENILNKIRQAIQTKDFYTAENYLALAKSNRVAYMYEDRITNLEKRIENLKKNFILSTISINKKTYIPQEIIDLEVSINQDGYLYIFNDTGDDIEMLYPNDYQRRAKVKKNDTKYFPNDDVDLRAYEESLNKDTKIIVIASKKNLHLKKDAIDNIDGVYIFKKDIFKNPKISRCLQQAECSKNITKYKVSNKTDKKVTIKIIAKQKLKDKIKKIFLSKGIKSQKSDIKIIFNIKKENKYSKELDINIETYLVTAKLYKNNKLQKKETEEYGENELEDIVNIYLTLLK